MCWAMSRMWRRRLGGLPELSLALCLLMGNLQTWA
jgi:hypothetical protein